MSDRAELFLGIIAVATLATAIVQIGVLVLAGLLARRIQRLIEHIDQELKPIFGQINAIGEHLNAIGRDASRAASLATAQVERVDRAVTDLIQRLDVTLGALQTFVTGAAKDGSAFVTGFRAIFSLIRDLRAGRRRSRADDEDVLFI